jgi:hypothetical protein
MGNHIPANKTLASDLEDFRKELDALISPQLLPAAFASGSVAPELDYSIPETVTVLSNTNQPVTLSTKEFSWDAIEVYSSGQCAALAVALSDQFEDGVIKAATAQNGSVLVHVYVEADGLVIDAGHFYEPVEGLEESMYYDWGTVDIQEYSKEELVSWLSGDDVPNRQNWQAAEYMMPAYIDHYLR